MRELVDDGGTPCSCRWERVRGRHLDVIGVGRIEGAFAADADDRLAVGDDRLCCLRRAPRCLRDRRRHVAGDAVDLARVEQREGAQQRDALRHLRVAGGLVVITDFDPLEEIRGGAARAAAYLPAALGGLPVGGPARIAAVEGKWRHAEHHHIDAAVADACCGIARHAGSGRLAAIPRPAPGSRAGLEGRDHLIGHLGVVVARWDAGPAGAMRLVGHGVSFPHGLLDHPKNPASRRAGARARQRRGSAPRDNPLRRHGGDAVDRLPWALFPGAFPGVRFPGRSSGAFFRACAGRCSRLIAHGRFISAGLPCGSGGGRSAPAARPSRSAP